MTRFPLYTQPVPYVTTQQMIEVDRAMIEDYGILLIQMMENAGRNLAHLARQRFLDDSPTEKQVVIMAGTGGNGGGALVCARRLKNYGANVIVYTTALDEKFTPIPKHQLNILHAMKIPVALGDYIASATTPDLIIDGIIGYNLKRAPYGTAEIMIRWANSQSTPILSLDAPSGLDTTSGTVFDPAIKATATMTLALPKEGFRQDSVSEQIGELYLADISVPPELYAQPNLAITVDHIFAESDIIRLT